MSDLFEILVLYKTISLKLVSFGISPETRGFGGILVVWDRSLQKILFDLVIHFCDAS